MLQNQGLMPHCKVYFTLLAFCLLEFTIWELGKISLYLLESLFATLNQQLGSFRSRHRKISAFATWSFVESIFGFVPALKNTEPVIKTNLDWPDIDFTLMQHFFDFSFSYTCATTTATLFVEQTPQKPWLIDFLDGCNHS